MGLSFIGLTSDQKKKKKTATRIPMRNFAASDQVLTQS